MESTLTNFKVNIATRKRIIMPTNTLSMKRRVINTLANGRGLTASEAKSKYGVKNMRAMMSSIRSLVEAYGNWEITSEETPTGKTRYYMEDTHPGERSYGFDSNGHRFLLDD
tara:strand:- start:382 stop:717 length:336 start_codon:yes stop_codon:yes gene_type:complete